MVSDAVRAVAEEMPDHQSSRGAEFRTLSVEDRLPMARQLVIARSQVNASNADWNCERYRYHMRQKKETYLYHAGRLGVDIEEADNIWWSIVHDNPAPVEKQRDGLI